MDLAREIDGVLQLPDFARKFVHRVVDLTGANAGAFALFKTGLQTAAIHPPGNSAASGRISETPGLSKIVRKENFPIMSSSGGSARPSPIS